MASAHEEQLQMHRANKVRLLNEAAQFAALYARSKPLFSKTLGTGRTRKLVQVEWPGVLRVYDASTGGLLVESSPGDPLHLSAQMHQNPMLGPGV